MNNPQTIADYYMEQMRHLTNEVVICAYFDVKSRFLGDKFISKGSLSSSVVDIGSIIGDRPGQKCIKACFIAQSSKRRLYSQQK